MFRLLGLQDVFPDLWALNSINYAKDTRAKFSRKSAHKVPAQFPETGTASRLLAQDIIIDPTKLVTLGPPAILSELAMARIGGMSPTTGLLTSADPVVRGLSPFFGSQLSQVPINETEE